MDPKANGYKLVFFDDFDEDTINKDKWYVRGNGSSRCGFGAASQVFQRDGKLVIRAEHRETGDYGEGWYSGSLATRKRYLRGYFEISCICSDTEPSGFWSAFWMQAQHPYEPEISRGGIGGAEIDIFEAFYNTARNTVCIETAVHCAGMKNSTAAPGKLDSHLVGRFFPEGICTGYHIYGFEWTENEYIFYIDGEETVRSSWGDGVSEEQEEVILSLCIPKEYKGAKTNSFEFKVEYIKIWQK